VYCQLGVDGVQTIERKEYVPIADVLSQLREELTAGLKADHITLSGSGEPTLNSRLAELIDGIKKLTNIPTALITNGTLFKFPDVRADCAKADVVLPSLDAGDQEVFSKINCPHSDISFSDLVDGLCKFRAEYTGQIWLEVFLADRINTTDDQIEKIKALVHQIRPDKVQLNTAVRPTTQSSVKRVQPDKLRSIAEKLGPNAEVIADFSEVADIAPAGLDRQKILEMLRRRPANMDDICNGLGIDRPQADKVTEYLQRQGLIDSESSGGKTFFRLT
jgi:wyosine [tRNA(Phe)-imidazoG37] synthetase (radical SAM superfamily)